MSCHILEAGYLGKRPPLHIIKPGPGPQSLSIQQTRRAKGIEPHHPVPHDLQTYRADPRRRGSGAAVDISHDDKSRRAWFAHFDPRANRLNDAASKSSRNPIAEPMNMPSKTTEPLIQTFIALRIPRLSQSLRRLV